MLAAAGPGDVQQHKKIRSRQSAERRFTLTSMELVLLFYPTFSSGIVSKVFKKDHSLAPTFGKLFVKTLDKLENIF
jgi:hypothetical protein